jgi:hypothetical protein
MTRRLAYLFSWALLFAVPCAVLAQTYQNGQLQVATAAVPNSDFLASAGARMSPNIPFYRVGEPFIIPFTPTSGAVEVMVAPPPGTTSFQYTNNSPCAVRFRGRIQGAAFTALTPATGWLWLPGTSRVYTSLQPISVAAMGVDGPNASVQAAQKACSGTLELQYGTGQ